MINQVMLVGRLTADVEVKKTKTGISVCDFRVACDRPVKEDGTHEADFITCQGWKATADYLGKWAKKGNTIIVSGKIRTDSYEDRDGKKLYTTKVIVDRCKLFGSFRANSDENQNYVESYSYEEDNGLNNAKNGSPMTMEELPF